MENEACVRCGRELRTAKTINQTADPGVSIYLSAGNFSTDAQEIRLTPATEYR